jgi:hypothetical protein
MADNPFQFPVNDIDAASIAMHEMFKAHLAAGFTEDQAIKLICHLMAAMREPPAA